MTESGTRMVPPSARQASGAARWFSSEWGLAALALVLAVLVWAVMWRSISGTADVDVEVDVRTPKGLVAYQQGKVHLTLYGPRGELERARTALGTPPRVLLNQEGIPAERNEARVLIDDPAKYAFPFPRRLVTEVSQTEVEIYRWKSVQVRFEDPEILDRPSGLRVRVTLDPVTSLVHGPAGKVPATIRPDPISVSPWFREGRGALPPDPQEITLDFSTWREDSDEARYRHDVELPAVKARLEFEFEGEREIRNRIEFLHPEGYVVEPSGTEQDVDQGYYRGRFMGVERDLTTLERATDSWWYVVRIPADKLPADPEGERTEYLPIEYAHTAALDPLRVKFPVGATLLLVIRRR